MEKILVIGDANYTKVIINVIEDLSKYEIFGIIDCFNVGVKVGDYKVIGKKSDISELIKKHNLIGGVLAVEDNYERKKAFDLVSRLFPNFNFLSIVHPTAIIGKNVHIGKGVILMAGVVINSDSYLGDFCLMETQSTLGHEGKLKEFSTISFGVITGGNLQLGILSKISLGSNIIENITIGNSSIIDAGSLVLTDIPEFSRANGVPAKVYQKLITVEGKSD